MEEIWKDIEGYEGYYQVSNLGRVRSLPRKIRYYNKQGVRVVQGIRERILCQGNCNGYTVVKLLKNSIEKIIWYTA